MSKRWCTPNQLLFALAAASLAACSDAREESSEQGDPSQFGTSISGACATPSDCGATPRYDLSVIANTTMPFPTTMAPGEKIVGRPVMQNTGTGTWDSTNYKFTSNVLPRSFWGTTSSSVLPTVAVGGLSPHNILMRAPTTPGSYLFSYIMRNVTPPTAYNFGTSFDRTITVVAGQQRIWDCAYDSDTAPSVIPAGTTADVTFRIRNSGTANWSVSGSCLRQLDGNTWGPVNCVALDPARTLPVPGGSIVPPNGMIDVPWRIGAPSTPGTYVLARQLSDNRTNGVGLFDPDASNACVNLTILVQSCGNALLDDPSEECDDGNLVSNDGCSDTCHLESVRTVDLATESAERSIFGDGENKGLGNVASGNLLGSDTIPDVCVGDISSASVVGQKVRTTAGRVHCYTGVNFYANGDVTVPTGASFIVLGATSGDHMGGSEGGRIVMGDVTGDGRPDLIASAPLGDGPGEARTDTGEVYFIPASASLSGTLDLAAPTAALRTTIYGRAPGDNLRVLFVGDVTGDGVRDVVLGAPGDDRNGVDAGAVYVLSGSVVSAGGVIDLATATPFALYLGAAAGDGLGSVATIGDVNGDSVNDLILGSGRFSTPGRIKNGAVWAYFGPLAASSVTDVGVSWSLRIIGSGDYVNLGRSISVGEVTGIGVHYRDLIVGIPQERWGGLQVGAVDIFRGPIAVPPGDATIDELTVQASTRIWGIEDGDQTGANHRLGDWNNDGYNDIAVVAPGGDGPTNALDGAGEVTIVYGHRSLPANVFLSTVHPLKVYGRASRDLMGTHASDMTFVDFDGDHRTDLCVGSYRGEALRQGRVDCFAP